MRHLLWLRAVAILIAVAGVIDPVFTVIDRERPEVAITSDSRLPDHSLIERVSGTLARRFTIVRGPTVGAAAVVHIGHALPDPAMRRVSPAFVVVPEPRSPWVEIESVGAPARAHLHSRVPVAVQVRSAAARGRTIAVTLESGGIAIDRVTREIASDDDRQTFSLMFAAAVTPGTVPLIVRAEIAGEASLAPTTARADLGIEMRERRWAVLAFDRRPSWMSTFVRRALETDPRFVVTSRIVTSRGAAVDAGRPPASLSELPSLSLFDAVIAGAPAELSDADVRSLETFMRERGGAVMLLPDEPAAGRPYQRLLGHTPWRFLERPKPTGEPSASAFFSPNPEQSDAIWRRAVGPGRLVVATALDSWRFRDQQSGAFDRFWRLVVAEAADATPLPLDIVPDRLVLAPGETTTARVFAGPASEARPIRIRPSVVAGPESVVITRDGARAETAVIVVPGAARPAGDQRALVETWARSRGGLLLPESRLEDLGPALDRALTPAARSTRWFPARSPWLIVPFALALGAEWWQRRRRGLR